MVVRHVCLYLKAVADDVTGDAYGRLVPAFVPRKGLYFVLGEERRITQGDLPFLVEQVAGLYVEPLPAVYEGICLLYTSCRPL